MDFIMKDSNVVLSAPLQQLMDEHVPLRKDMDQFYEITEEIDFESGAAVVQLFMLLHERITAFSAALSIHAKREEEGLFPMMTRYLGEDDRTIRSMEFEHEKAEKHLQDFLTEASQAGPTIDEDNAKSITVYAAQAYATLTQHFAKEEKMLFPLAETILSADEMDELERFLRVQ